MASNLIRVSSSLVLVVLVALTVQIFYFSPIDPVLLDIKPVSLTKDNKLQNIIKLGEGLLKEPEDVCVDKEGTLYTATRDGWIKRLRRNNGNWENWKHMDSDTLIGITTAKEGGIIVCDVSKGLFKVTEKDGFSVLVSQVNGSQLRFADDAIEASDGNIYFSVLTTKFDMQNWYLDVLEARPHGQVLKYNPTSNETVIFLDKVAFANGVALSKDEDYLVVCETWKYRCIRHWLKGANKGITDVLIENLPGAPDNINLAPDGSFWIALVQLTSEGLEFVHKYKITKHLVASFPRLINLVNGLKTSKAMVVNVATDGKIIRKFDDADGKVITFVTSALEFEDHLYLDPVLLDIKPAPSTKDNQLQNIIKLGEGLLKEPEDVCVDKEGTLYTATRDGWIKRLRRNNGNWENWKHIDSHTLLGIATAKEGGLIVCDTSKGLLKVTEEDGFSVLVSQVNGSQLRFADDVIEASNGNVYFSVVSTKFDLQDWYLDVLEARPHGQVLKYNPTSNETLIVLDNVAFANGVALSKDEDYLVVCETWKYRCLRHWLKGANKGTTDIFIENLPGAPDNINLAPDGSFWIALIQLTSEGFEFVHNYKITKHLVASFPRLINLINGAKKKATVVNVATNGQIIRKLDDSDGKVINFVTSAVEFEDHLYLGSLNSNFVGKLPLYSA